MYALTIILAIVALAAIGYAIYVKFSNPRAEFTSDMMVLELKRELEQLRKDSALQFQALASDSLGHSSMQLRQENQRQLDALLSPLRERIDSFSKIVRDSHIDSMSSQRSLNDQIERLARLNTIISEDARSLSQALRGDHKLQGEWGETVLETMLEREGLRRGVNFDIQLTRDSSGQPLRGEGGGLLRPDVVVYLPGGNCIIIDSKVSLSAYLDYCSASNPEMEKKAAARHLESVRRHIDELSSKKYQKVVKGAAEQVLMFIPNDGAFLAAMKFSHDLTDYAAKRDVVIVSPAHLLSVIHLVSQLWREERQQANAAEIAKMAGNLYDKVAAFASDLQNIERHLESAQSSYRGAYSKLVEGNQSVIRRAEKLRDLGARTTKRINERMLSDSILWEGEEPAEDKDDSVSSDLTYRGEDGTLSYKTGDE